MNLAAKQEAIPPGYADPRDGRYRSRMDASVQAVDAMVAEWARWGRSAYRELGFPAETMLGRVARCGFTGAAQRGAPLAMPEAVFRVEQAVLSLRQIERSVVVEHYMHWQPVEVSARERGMSPGRFRTLLHRARRELKSLLT